MPDLSDKPLTRSQEPVFQQCIGFLTAFGQSLSLGQHKQALRRGQVSPLQVHARGRQRNADFIFLKHVRKGAPTL